MLMCYARGRSKISYHWEHHSNRSGEWNAKTIRTESGLLLLPSVTDDDEGEYSCVACDCYSCSYSVNTTTLMVYGKMSLIV